MKNLLLAVNKSDLMKSLEILWKGMLAIVVVVGVVILATYVMQAISKHAQNKKSDSKTLSDENNEVQ